MDKIDNVSEIFCKVTGKNRFSYGFTVSYQNGSFRNIIYISNKAEDKALQLELGKKRTKYIERHQRSQDNDIKKKS